MNAWEVIVGLILLVAGVALFWNGYNQLLRCNSTGGQIATAISNLFRGSGIQACNNAGIFEVVGIVAAILGVIILFLGALNRPKH